MKTKTDKTIRSKVCKRNGVRLIQHLPVNHRHSAPNHHCRHCVELVITNNFQKMNLIHRFTSFNWHRKNGRKLDLNAAVRTKNWQNSVPGGQKEAHHDANGEFSKSHYPDSMTLSAAGTNDKIGIEGKNWWRGNFKAAMSIVSGLIKGDETDIKDLQIIRTSCKDFYTFSCDKNAGRDIGICYMTMRFEVQICWLVPWTKYKPGFVKSKFDTTQVDVTGNIDFQSDSLIQKTTVAIDHYK